MYSIHCVPSPFVTRQPDPKRVGLVGKTSLWVVFLKIVSRVIKVIQEAIAPGRGDRERISEVRVEARTRWFSREVTRTADGTVRALVWILDGGKVCRRWIQIPRNWAHAVKRNGRFIGWVIQTPDKEVRDLVERGFAVLQKAWSREGLYIVGSGGIKKKGGLILATAKVVERVKAVFGVEDALSYLSGVLNADIEPLGQSAGRFKITSGVIEDQILVGPKAWHTLGLKRPQWCQIRGLGVVVAPNKKGELKRRIVFMKGTMRGMTPAEVSQYGDTIIIGDGVLKGRWAKKAQHLVDVHIYKINALPGREVTLPAGTMMNLWASLAGEMSPVAKDALKNIVRKARDAFRKTIKDLGDLDNIIEMIQERMESGIQDDSIQDIRDRQMGIVDGLRKGLLVIPGERPIIHPAAYDMLMKLRARELREIVRTLGIRGDAKMAFTTKDIEAGRAWVSGIKPGTRIAVWRHPQRQGVSILEVERAPFRIPKGAIIVPQETLDLLDGDCDGDLLAVSADADVVSVFGVVAELRELGTIPNMPGHTWKDEDHLYFHVASKKEAAPLTTSNRSQRAMANIVEGWMAEGTDFLGLATLAFQSAASVLFPMLVEEDESCGEFIDKYITAGNALHVTAQGLKKVTRGRDGAFTVCSGIVEDYMPRFLKRKGGIRPSGTAYVEQPADTGGLFGAGLALAQACNKVWKASGKTSWIKGRLDGTWVQRLQKLLSTRGGVGSDVLLRQLEQRMVKGYPFTKTGSPLIDVWNRWVRESSDIQNLDRGERKAEFLRLSKEIQAMSESLMSEAVEGHRDPHKVRLGLAAWAWLIQHSPTQKGRTRQGAAGFLKAVRDDRGRSVAEILCSAIAHPDGPEGLKDALEGAADSLL